MELCDELIVIPFSFIQFKSVMTVLFRLLFQHDEKRAIEVQHLLICLNLIRFHSLYWELQ